MIGNRVLNGVVGHSAEAAGRDAGGGRNVIALPACASIRPVGFALPAINPTERILLTRLRWWLVQSRLTPRASAEEACFVLRGEARASAASYAVAWFGLLDRHARRRLVFYRPRVEACSLDERWLIQLLTLVAEGDDASVRAMIAWRIMPIARRRARFLLAGLGRTLSEGQLEAGPWRAGGSP